MGGLDTLFASETVALSDSERGVLHIFRRYLVTPGKMLCLDAPNLRRYESALRRLTSKGMLVKEKFHGGYSLTTSGFAAMKQCA